MKRQLKTAVVAVMAMTLLAGCGSKASIEDAKVTLGEYKGIELSLAKAAVTDADIDEYIESALDYYNTYGENSRNEVAEGDDVAITMYLSTDSVGTAEEQFVTVGEGRIYPEVEETLIGAKTGDALEVPVALDNGEAVAYVTVVRILPDDVETESMTDEQAGLVMAALGMDGDETVAGLRAGVKELLSVRGANTERVDAYSMICSYLLDTCTVDPFPELELETRLEKSVARAEAQSMSYYGMTLAQYCESINVTEKQYKQDMSDILSDEIKLELIYAAIGDAEGIQYEESEYQSYVDSIVGNYGYDTVDDFYADYGEDWVKAAFRTEYIVDWLIENAQITYTTTTDGTVSGNGD